LVKLQVTLSDSLPHPGLVGSSWWVLPPVVTAPGKFPKPLVGPGACIAGLGAEAAGAVIDWDAAGCQTLHVTGCAIEPTSEYEVHAVAGASIATGPTVSTGLRPAGGRWWGDVVGVFNGMEWTPPQGTANIDDALVAINTFQGGQVVAPTPGSTVAHLSVVDVAPGNINTVVNFADVQILIKAFQGEMYPYGPANTDGDCP
ncbi:MAG: hypothetical protein IH987_14680, partial [Planctomycetes bacterium]|nr:hypothetical protein [Planctomycetota bacterium]